MGKRTVISTVKDDELITMRRNQMVKAAVKLFQEKGFHRATTREIAKEAGFSIGTLYEYIRTKDDILYLVCDQIYDQVKHRLDKDVSTSLGNLKGLKSAIAFYFKIMDDMQDEVVVMYQELKSLPKDALPYVLQKELEMVEMFKELLESCVESGECHCSKEQINMIAHNIFVQGQMWSFRRWALKKHYTIEQYTEHQICLLLNGITKPISV